ncbi:hypothetical protein [Subtercola boreus]|uniref:hypothetical protein n=1 Tax=Subtercola boreus TaxID=120213 RepID=UPI0011C0636D|nr:hypothetical protein [Subtercola boreus]
MAYVDEHPNDLAGIESLTNRLYQAKPLSVSIDGSAESYSGREAQAILNRKAALPSNAPLQSKSLSAKRAVPVDAFSVAFTFIPRPNTGSVQFAAYGTWNFRDDYVNGSAPDDFASNRLSIDSSCVSINNTLSKTYTYDNVVTQASYLYDSGLGVTNAPIVGLRDAASGFKLNVDHGYVMTQMNQFPCGPTTVRGAFTYEHNQDGGSVIGVTASFAGFGVSYNGNPTTLKKSSGIVSRTA